MTAEQRSTKFKAGDMVCMTLENLAALKTANKNRCSGVSWVSDKFYNDLMEFKCSAGQVSHTFPPGHDTAVRFYWPNGADTSFHMRSSFITRAAAAYGGGLFIVYPDTLNREETEAGGSLEGLFRVSDAKKGQQTSLFSLSDCHRIAAAVHNGNLKEAFGTEELGTLGTFMIDLQPAGEKRVGIIHGDRAEAIKIALRDNPGYTLKE